LVEEGDAEGEAAEWGEEPQCGDDVVGGAGEPDEGAAAGEEVLGGREGCGEEGVGRSQNFEGGICRGLEKWWDGRGKDGTW
jgi:hypothetical protein